MNWWVLRRRPHISWLIAIMCISLVTGVFSAQYIPAGMFASVAWGVSAATTGALCLRYRYVYLIPVLVVSGSMIGIWRGSLATTELDAANPIYSTVVTVRGTVREDVDSDASGKSILRLSISEINTRPFKGMVWASATTDLDIKRGDIVTVHGRFTQGFGSFVASMYQANVTAVERPQPGDVARVARDWFADAIRIAIPSPESSLGIGYLVGQKRALPADLVEALQIAGLTHVVVASGYNLTILVRLARRLFEKISKYLSALSASAMIAGFIAITGMSPSMSRAGLVAGLSLAAWYYGRKFHPLILLSFAAAVTVIVNPSYAWGDLGWQLSFAAFAGVMILAPLLQQFFFGTKKPGFVRQILGETIAAVIATAPILIGAFGQFSNVAVLANLLVLPLVPLAMLLTCIAGIGALLFPWFALIIGMPATWLLTYMTGVAHYLSGLSWSVSVVHLPPVGVAICYVVLITLCIVLWRVTKYDLRESNIVE